MGKGLDITVLAHAVDDYFSPVLKRSPHHTLHDARANWLGWLAYCDTRQKNQDCR